MDETGKDETTGTETESYSPEKVKDFWDKVDGSLRKNDRSPLTAQTAAIVKDNIDLLQEILEAKLRGEDDDTADQIPFLFGELLLRAKRPSYGLGLASLKTGEYVETIDNLAEYSSEILPVALTFIEKNIEKLNLLLEKNEIFTADFFDLVFVMKVFGNEKQRQLANESLAAGFLQTLPDPNKVRLILSMIPEEEGNGIVNIFWDSLDRINIKEENVNQIYPYLEYFNQRKREAFVEKYINDLPYLVPDGIPDGSEVSVNYLLPVLKFGSEEQARSALSEVLPRIKDEINCFQSASVLSKWIFDYGGSRQSGIFPADGSLQYQTYRNILTGFGLDFNEVTRGMKSFDLACAQPKSEIGAEAFSLNFEAMCELEVFRPGIVKYLWKECKIRNFGRYPTSVLIKQYDERDNTDIPYGFVFYPESDYNGAFFQDNYRFLLLSGKLESFGYILRIYEGHTPANLGGRILRLDKKYGSGQKISFAIIGGHGSVERGVTLIFVSCSSWEIGQMVSKLGGETFATKSPSYLKQLDVDQDSTTKRLVFNVKFADTVTKEDTTARFVGGEEKAGL